MSQNFVHLYNPFDLRFGSYRPAHEYIQEIVEYCESRFRAAIPHIANEKQSAKRVWMQECLSSELQFAMSYVGLGVSMGQTLEVPVFTRSLATAFARRADTPSLLHFDMDLLLALDAGSHPDDPCALVKECKHAWWAASRRPDADGILNTLTLVECLKVYRQHRASAPAASSFNKPMYTWSRGIFADPDADSTADPDADLQTRCRLYRGVSVGVEDNLEDTLRQIQGMRSMYALRRACNVRRASGLHRLRDAAARKASASGPGISTFPPPSNPAKKKGKTAKGKEPASSALGTGPISSSALAPPLSRPLTPAERMVAAVVERDASAYVPPANKEAFRWTSGPSLEVADLKEIVRAFDQDMKRPHSGYDTSLPSGIEAGEYSEASTGYCAPATVVPACYTRLSGDIIEPPNLLPHQYLTHFRLYPLRPAGRAQPPLPFLMADHPGPVDPLLNPLGAAFRAGNWPPPDAAADAAADEEEEIADVPMPSPPPLHEFVPTPTDDDVRSWATADCQAWLETALRDAERARDFLTPSAFAGLVQSLWDAAGADDHPVRSGATGYSGDVDASGSEVGSSSWEGSGLVPAERVISSEVGDNNDEDNGKENDDNIFAELAMGPIALPEMSPEGVPTVGELFEPEDTPTDLGIGASGAVPFGRAALPDPLTSDSDGMAIDPFPGAELPDPDSGSESASESDPHTGVSPTLGRADLPDPLSSDSDGMGLEVPAVDLVSGDDTEEDDSGDSDFGVAPAPHIIDLTRVDSSDVEDRDFSVPPAPEIINLTRVDDDVIFEDDTGDNAEDEDGGFEDEDDADGEGGLEHQELSQTHAEEVIGTGTGMTSAVTPMPIPTVGPATQPSAAPVTAGPVPAGPYTRAHFDHLPTSFLVPSPSNSDYDSLDETEDEDTDRS